MHMYRIEKAACTYLCRVHVTNLTFMLPLPPRTHSMLCQPECTNDCQSDGLRSHVLLQKGVHVVGVSVSQEGGALLVGINDQWPPTQGEGQTIINALLTTYVFPRKTGSHYIQHTSPHTHMHTRMHTHTHRHTHAQTLHTFHHWPSCCPHP